MRKTRRERLLARIEDRYRPSPPTRSFAEYLNREFETLPDGAGRIQAMAAFRRANIAFESDGEAS